VAQRPSPSITAEQAGAPSSAAERTSPDLAPASGGPRPAAVAAVGPPAGALVAPGAARPLGLAARHRARHGGEGAARELPRVSALAPGGHGRRGPLQRQPEYAPVLGRHPSFPSKTPCDDGFQAMPLAVSYTTSMRTSSRKNRSYQIQPGGARGPEVGRGGHPRRRVLALRDAHLDADAGPRKGICLGRGHAARPGDASLLLPVPPSLGEGHEREHQRAPARLLPEGREPTDEEVQGAYATLNRRPRKRLGWKCPE
jgi:hypothetical protein